MSHQHSHGGQACHGHGKNEPQHQAPTNFLQACTAGALGIVCAFYEGEDSLLLADDAGCTAMHWAALNGHTEIVRFLLDNGNPVDAKESQGQTALHFAASQNHCETIVALLDAGFSPYAADANNNTPHGTAACNDAVAALHVLQTRARLDPAHCDGQGNTVLAWGAYKGNLDVVRHSHEMFGVPCDTTGKLNRTPLHWAAREGHTEICVYLMGKGLDPNQVDAENKSALQYAKERHHHETETALAERRTAPVERNIGTFRALFRRHNGYLVHINFLGILVAYIIVDFVLLQWLPPFLLFSMLVGWIMKNNVYGLTRWVPVLSHRVVSEREAILGDVGGSFQECCEGPKHLWGRDPVGVFGIPFLIIIQLYVLGGGGGHMELPSFLKLSAHNNNNNNNNNNNDNEHHAHHGLETNIPIAIVWCLLFAKILAVVVKMLSTRDVIPNNTNVADYPLWDAIDKKQWDDVKAAADIFDKEAMIRKPARAFWCRQIGHVIRRYDSWSVMLDCPINHHNTRWFMFFLISLFLCQFFMVRSTWEAAMIRNGCLVPDHTSNAAAVAAAPVYRWAHELHPETSTYLPPSHEPQNDDHHAHNQQEQQQQQHHHLLSSFNNNVFNWCTIIVNLVVQATPCADPHTLLGGHAFTKLTWREILVGNEQVRADVITILLPITLCCLFLVDIALIFRQATGAVSSAENSSTSKGAPCSEGGLTSIKKAHGFGSIYGEGSALANVFLFLVGKDGERWEGVMTVPPALKGAKKKIVHPLVIPAPTKKNNHDH